MICEKCASKKLKSHIYEMYSNSTCIGYRDFYDEEGKRHSHDPNIILHQYRCSNGHEWDVKSKHSCWCGWGKE